MPAPNSLNWNKFWLTQPSESSDLDSWSKRRILNVLGSNLFSGRSVLDAGCGSGYFSRIFCDLGMQTVSLDYSDKALDIARQITSGRSTVCKADMLSDNLHIRINKKFDLIFSDGLFEHFTAGEQDKIMSNLLSLLSENGVMATFVPNRYSPWQWIRPFYMPGITETPFVLKELVDLNQRNGLTVISDGGINTLPFKFSPEKGIARYCGMLLYTLARKHHA